MRRESATDTYTKESNVVLSSRKDYETDRTHLHRFSFHSIRRLLENHFTEVTTLPYGGHLLGGGKTGIPITSRTPRFVAELFAAMILWNAKGLKKEKHSCQ